MLLMLNQFLIWLLRPKVCKFVCVASSVVGLLCSARSSSLNILRKWIWWKILIYIVLSFFICSLLLFVTERQRSIALWLKAHLTFFALIACVIYSIVFDTVVAVKPDAYSAISCASFSIMCLCLSRLTTLGFEIEFLYFFCGDLIVQLWKIEHWLVIIGLCFIYFLVVIPLLSLETLEDRLPLQDRNQVAVQSRSNSEVVNAADRDSTLNTPPPPPPPPENGDDDHNSLLGPAFLSDDRIVSLSNSPSHEENVDCGLMRLLMDCVGALEKENKRLVRIVSSHVYKYIEAMVDSESEGNDEIAVQQLDLDANLVMDALPSGIIKRLRETGKQMIEAGYEVECCKAYIKWRVEFVKQCLSALGLQSKVEFLKQCLSALRLQSKEEKDAENWMKTFKAAGLILFHNETTLCHSVFPIPSIIKDTSLSKVCEELMIHPLSFTHSIIITASYLPNLFLNTIPKMSQLLYDLRQMCQSIIVDWMVFLEDGVTFSLEVATEALNTLKMIGYCVYSNTDQATVAGGGVHQITKQVTTNISLLCEYLRDWRNIEERMRLSRGVGNFPFSLRIAQIITLLESKLEAKSRDYNDPALGYVFMINNLTYMGHVLRSIVGVKLDDDWFIQNTANVEQNCKLYQSSSWNKMLEFLKLERNESVAANVVAESMKVKLNLFNNHFEEICNVQSTWIVSDKQLREQIIKSIESILLPAYGKFTDRSHDVFGKHAYKYIEYGIVDIQNYLGNLFLLSE